MENITLIVNGETKAQISCKPEDKKVVTDILSQLGRYSAAHNYNFQFSSSKTSADILAENEIIDSLFEVHCKAEQDIKERMCKSINDMCKAMGGVCEVDNDIDDSPLITYDGGHHCEYASTICGIVERVRATNKNNVKSFEVDLEQERNYEASRIDLGDVGQIYDFVCGKYEEFLLDNPDEE